MSTRPRPPLEGHPQPARSLNPAKPALTKSGSGAPKDVAEGVPSSVCSDPRAGDGRYPVAWLTITAPRGATPTATSVCDCGRSLFAAGQRQALALIEDHARHRDLCPLRTTEERNAA
ncbi:hypothetical protein PUR34_41625 [Streptomyces sp. JV185]|uniref:hypothetical protein n=1 Tax=Streptomyces sp. JV185 TaxID=858638 RepID=UPI002E79E441|nr:hypothetical protein [Streptomyces sp. JV185]MEE1774506.1 hypothetical protein [Streptomyces sp. JV185]